MVGQFASTIRWALNGIQASTNTHDTQCRDTDFTADYILTVTMILIANHELGTCKASLVPPEQFVLSIPEKWCTDMAYFLHASIHGMITVQHSSSSSSNSNNAGSSGS